MSKSVLIVDDSFMMRTLISDIISADPDLKVVGDAENGKVALEKAKTLKPDVILLDIEMPEMDGLETLKRLSLTSKAKVIIISSVAQAGSTKAMEARSRGAIAVIPKPSGAVSLDIRDKKGHEIVQAARKAVGLAA